SPSQGSRIRQFTAPANKLRVTCDLHSNMLMYVYVFDHPYFAVTGEDGRFEIQGLPPGDYEVTARHGVGGAQKAQVEIPAGGASEDLEFVYRR
ncbi:MAG: carboxypeptidase regulatory-like domain-containing protein, partial [Planctomycetes bacterium]|nr:carboxypeptidase regulatory-like domain-containing protein [Planctomycetota bacterium]